MPSAEVAAIFVGLSAESEYATVQYVDPFQQTPPHLHNAGNVVVVQLIPSVEVIVFVPVEAIPQILFDNDEVIVCFFQKAVVKNCAEAEWPNNRLAPLNRGATEFARTVPTPVLIISRREIFRSFFILVSWSPSDIGICTNNGDVENGVFA